MGHTTSDELVTDAVAARSGGGVSRGASTERTAWLSRHIARLERRAGSAASESGAPSRKLIAALAIAIGSGLIVVAVMCTDAEHSTGTKSLGVIGVALHILAFLGLRNGFAKHELAEAGKRVLEDLARPAEAAALAPHRGAWLGAHPPDGTSPAPPGGKRRMWVPVPHNGECLGAPTPDKPWCNDDAHWKEKDKWRANYVPGTAFYQLNFLCKFINEAFGDFGCYLVGSAIYRRDFRDVDVRYIMANDAYDRLFKDDDRGYTNPLWSLLCISITHWLSTQTGLQIDFQIQRQSDANREHAVRTGHERQPLGIFLDYAGKRPTDIAAAKDP